MIQELEAIYQPIEAELSSVEQDLEQQLHSESPFVSAIVGDVLRGGGKRLRPALVLLTARVGQNGHQPLVRVASAIELIHTATLVHDDVVDGATRRRQYASINAQWGDDIGLIFGDYLFTKAFALLVETRLPEVVSRCAQVTALMCEGELLQMEHRFDPETTEAEYLEVIQKKTACLMSAACEIGARLGGAGPEEVAAWAAFGLHFGMAFQIVDDCLDLIGDEARLGKSLGSDIQKGKVTLPLIRLLDTLVLDESRRVADGLAVLAAREARGPQGVEEEGVAARVTAIRELVVRHRTTDFAFETAQAFINQAKASIAGVRDFPCRAALLQLADYAVSRDRM